MAILLITGDFKIDIEASALKKKKNFEAFMS